jgi:hypothetical protein
MGLGDFFTGLGSFAEAATPGIGKGIDNYRSGHKEMGDRAMELGGLTGNPDLIRQGLQHYQAGGLVSGNTDIGPLADQYAAQGQLNKMTKVMDAYKAAGVRPNVEMLKQFSQAMAKAQGLPEYPEIPNPVARTQVRNPVRPPMMANPAVPMVPNASLPGLLPAVVPPNMMPNSNRAALPMTPNPSIPQEVTNAGVNIPLFEKDATSKQLLLPVAPNVPIPYGDQSLNPGANKYHLGMWVPNVTTKQLTPIDKNGQPVQLTNPQIQAAGTYLDSAIDAATAAQKTAKEQAQVAALSEYIKSHPDYKQSIPMTEEQVAASTNPAIVQWRDNNPAQVPASAEYQKKWAADHPQTQADENQALRTVYQALGLQTEVPNLKYADEKKLPLQIENPNDKAFAAAHPGWTDFILDPNYKKTVPDTSNPIMYARQAPPPAANFAKLLEAPYKEASGRIQRALNQEWQKGTSGGDSATVTALNARATALDTAYNRYTAAVRDYETSLFTGDDDQITAARQNMADAATNFNSVAETPMPKYKPESRRAAQVKIIKNGSQWRIVNGSTGALIAKGDDGASGALKYVTENRLELTEVKEDRADKRQATGIAAKAADTAVHEQGKIDRQRTGIAAKAAAAEKKAAERRAEQAAGKTVITKYVRDKNNDKVIARKSITRAGTAAPAPAATATRPKTTLQFNITPPTN